MRPGYGSDMDAKALLTEALRLSLEERAALAGELIQSLDTEVDVGAVQRNPVEEGIL